MLRFAAARRPFGRSRRRTLTRNVAGVDVVYRVHALRRMLERGIDEGAVRSAIEAGNVVWSHPEDTPYPTSVFPGWQRSRPLHVVAAYNRADDRWIVVTAYEPDPRLWESDFRRRRP